MPVEYVVTGIFPFQESGLLRDEFYNVVLFLGSWVPLWAGNLSWTIVTPQYNKKTLCWGVTVVLLYSRLCLQQQVL